MYGILYIQKINNNYKNLRQWEKLLYW
jgi:hypothetical protein